MKSKHVEARFLKHHGNTTNILIKVGDSVVQASYSEVAPCAFPVWTSMPVQVEIPPSGFRSNIVGVTSEGVAQSNVDGGLPNIIKFPVYERQSNSTVEDFENLPDSSTRGNNISREPLAAIAISASGIMDGRKRVETHSVLPVWIDGTSVVVTLNWYDGEPSEGSPNPEWHLRATQGMPPEEGMRRLMESGPFSANVSECIYRINVSPWKLGASILEALGEETHHKVWQREWQFTEFDDFQLALGHLRDALTGLSRSEKPSMAEQRA